MNRLTLLLLFFCGPPQDSGTTSIHFPLNHRLKWIYETSDGRTQDKSVWEKTEGDAWRVQRLGPWGPFLDELAYVKVTASGVTIEKLGERKNLPWLKFPFTKGETWTVADFYTVEVLGEEEVKVPAGKFTATKVTTTLIGKATVLTTWYSRGMGEVKSEYSVTEADRPAVTGSRSLKSLEMKIDVSANAYPACVLSICDGRIEPPGKSDAEMAKRTDLDLWIEPGDPEIASMPESSRRLVSVGEGEKVFAELESKPTSLFGNKLDRQVIKAQSVFVVHTHEGAYAKVIIDEISAKGITLRYVVFIGPSVTK